MLEAASLREALSVAAPEVDPKTIVIEVGCSEIRVGFAGALHAACRLPAFVSRVPHAHGIQTLYGWEAFGDCSSSSSSSSYRHVFAAHPAHSASGGSSVDLLLLVLDEALDRVSLQQPHSFLGSSNGSSTANCNLLLMLPLPGEPQLVPLLLRWAFEQRRFERVKLMATERMVVYSHLPLLPDLCSQRGGLLAGALVVDVGECGLRVCPVEGPSLSPVSFCRASNRSSSQLLSELLLLHLRKRKLPPAAAAAAAAAAAGREGWAGGGSAAAAATAAPTAAAATTTAAKEEQQEDDLGKHEKKLQQQQQQEQQQQQQQQQAAAAAATHTPAHGFGAGSGRWGPQSLDWRDITRFKETQCYVSLDPALDLHLHRNHKQLRPLFTCSDGSVVQPWSETFLIPEVFFSPQLLPDANLAAVAPSMDHSSISEMVFGCFRRSSVCEREGWLTRICLVGGATQMPNFAQRPSMLNLGVYLTLSRLTICSMLLVSRCCCCCRVQVLPCENRQLAAFRGALLFGLVARQEPEAWLSRSLYERSDGLEKAARHMALFN
ncbi:hypothetical protein Efla_004778 [Eimeria flavescens]